ncbi:MAG: anti-sigma factor family protein [Opitutales bacterium]
MKNSRFTELINLYIDRQITPEETAELEAEIQANLHHRQIYQQYCRMHHATKLVYESFRAQADQPAGNRPLPGSIARFEHRQRLHQRNRWLYLAGGLAAAACLAFVFIRSLPSTGTPAAQPVLAQVTAPPAAVASARVAVPGAHAAARNFSAIIIREQPDYAAMLAALRQEDQRTFALNKTVRGSSLFDDGVFEGKPVLPLNVRPMTPFRKTDGSATVEFTAFQFQR